MGFGDIGEFMKELLPLYIVILIVICFFIIFNISVGVYRCSSKAELMQVYYRYQIINGCFIESNERFVPIENFREVV